MPFMYSDWPAWLWVSLALISCCATRAASLVELRAWRRKAGVQHSATSELPCGLASRIAIYRVLLAALAVHRMTCHPQGFTASVSGGAPWLVLLGGMLELAAHVAVLVRALHSSLLGYTPGFVLICTAGQTVGVVVQALSLPTTTHGGTASLDLMGTLVLQGAGLILEQEFPVYFVQQLAVLLALWPAHLVLLARGLPRSARQQELCSTSLYYLLATELLMALQSCYVAAMKPLFVPGSASEPASGLGGGGGAIPQLGSGLDQQHAMIGRQPALDPAVGARSSVSGAPGTQAHGTGHGRKERRPSVEHPFATTNILSQQQGFTAAASAAVAAPAGGAPTQGAVDAALAAASRAPPRLFIRQQSGASRTDRTAAPPSPSGLSAAHGTAGGGGGLGSAPRSSTAPPSPGQGLASARRTAVPDLSPGVPPPSPHRAWADSRDCSINGVLQYGHSGDGIGHSASGCVTMLAPQVNRARRALMYAMGFAMLLVYGVVKAQDVALRTLKPQPPLFVALLSLAGILVNIGGAVSAGLLQGQPRRWLPVTLSTLQHAEHGLCVLTPLLMLLPRQLHVLQLWPFYIYCVSQTITSMYPLKLYVPLQLALALASHAMHVYVSVPRAQTWLEMLMPEYVLGAVLVVGARVAMGAYDPDQQLRIEQQRASLRHSLEEMLMLQQQASGAAAGRASAASLHMLHRASSTTRLSQVSATHSAKDIFSRHPSERVRRASHTSNISEHLEQLLELRPSMPLLLVPPGTAAAAAVAAAAEHGRPWPLRHSSSRRIATAPGITTPAGTASVKDAAAGSADVVAVAGPPPQRQGRGPRRLHRHDSLSPPGSGSDSESEGTAARSAGDISFRRMSSMPSRLRSSRPHGPDVDAESSGRGEREARPLSPLRGGPSSADTFVSFPVVQGPSSAAPAVSPAPTSGESFGPVDPGVISPVSGRPSGTSIAASGDTDLRKEMLFRQLVMSKWKSVLQEGQEASGSSVTMLGLQPGPHGDEGSLSAVTSAHGDALPHSAAAVAAASAVAAAGAMAVMAVASAVASSSAADMQPQALVPAAAQSSTVPQRSSGSGVFHSSAASGASEGYLSGWIANHIWPGAAGSRESSRRSLFISSHNTSLRTSLISRSSSANTRVPAAPQPPVAPVAGAAAAPAATEPIATRLSGASLRLTGDVCALVVNLLLIHPSNVDLCKLMRRALAGEVPLVQLLWVAAGCWTPVAIVLHLVALLAAPRAVRPWRAALWSLRAVTGVPVRRLASTMLGIPNYYSTGYSTCITCFYLVLVRMSALQYAVTGVSATALQLVADFVRLAHLQISTLELLQQCLATLCCAIGGVALGIVTLRTGPAWLGWLLASPWLRRRLSSGSKTWQQCLTKVAAWLVADAESDGASIPALLLLLFVHEGVNRGAALLSARLGPSGLVHYTTGRPLWQHVSAYNQRVQLAWLQLPTPQNSPLLLAAALVCVIAVLAASQIVLISLLTGDGRRNEWLVRRKHALLLVKGQLLQAPSVSNLVSVLERTAADIFDGCSTWCLVLVSQPGEQPTTVVLQLHRQPDLNAWPLDTSEDGNALLDSGHGQTATVCLSDYPTLQACVEARELLVIQGGKARMYDPTASAVPLRPAAPLAADTSALADALGADMLLVAPVVCLEQRFGVLLVASAQLLPVDAHLRLVLSELADGLAQALYLKQMQAEVAASEAVMEDILPQDAVQMLKRRVQMHNPAVGAASHVGGIAGSAPGVSVSGVAGSGGGASGLPPLVGAASMASDISFPPLPRLGSGAGAGQQGSPAMKRNASNRRPTLEGAAPGVQPSLLVDTAEDAFTEPESVPALRTNSLLSSNGGVTTAQNGSQPTESNSGVAYGSNSGVLYKQWHSQVSVLFADIVNYTSTSQQLEPEQVMTLLHDLFCKYDSLLAQYNVYKVETIGDCYMAATGLTEESATHASDLVGFGKAMIAAARSVSNPVTGEPLQIRVGVHSGRVMSGIVGSCRARYCLFGDTVNTASRMESTGVAGSLQITEDTHSALPSEVQHDFSCRGHIDVKGKGRMLTYLMAVPEPCAQPPHI